MKITKTASGKVIKMSKTEWEEIGEKAGWTVEAKKKKKEKSPKEHGFMADCIKKNKDKDSPGGYCAKIVDKVKGTTKWRKGPKKKD